MNCTRPAPAIVAALVILSACGVRAADMVFPTSQWATATPESQHVNAAKLQAAIDYLEEAGGESGVKRMVVVRNGRVIWSGPEAGVPQRVWSVSKALTSTAHGLLIDDGKCTLDTLAKDYNPELTEHYGQVTLRHLATMTSGIDGTGGGYDYDPSGRGDQNALVAPLPPFFAPGARYMYWDEATQQYGQVLTKIAGEPLPDYLKRRVLDPIGVSQVEWQQDSTRKVPNWTGGLIISAGDLARFGLLYLNRGNWNGKQLLSAKWVDEATRVQVPASIGDYLPESDRRGSGVYGYHWWPNGVRPDGKRLWPDAPTGTYERSGHNNNHLFIIPEWQMVIVRLGLDKSDDPITHAEHSTFLGLVGEAIQDATVEGERRVWHPLTINFRGPKAGEQDKTPNPFLDFRLQVRLTAPSGKTYDAPGYFDGDGHGGGTGDAWRARFTPDEAGHWRYQASFRSGAGVAVSLDPQAGSATACDGAGGEFDVADRDAAAPGFFGVGRLEYVGKHYLKFRNGPYWIRGGTDEPENLLAYAGFDDTLPSHTYASHVEDWRPGDPDWGDGKARGIIGALNYLAASHVNSIYFLLMNVGGDGSDVWPWLSVANRKGDAANDNLHFDISKLRQWGTVFDHAQRNGLFLHFVFNEAEQRNKRELDDGELGPERKLYYREMIARFGYHLALEWNLCEEYNLQFDFGPQRVRDFADYIRSVDPYRHPVTVHSAGDPFEKLKFTFGDERFSMTSIQLSQRPISDVTEQFFRGTIAAGRPLPVSLDEFTLDRGQAQASHPIDESVGQRREKLWPTYLSGGNIEFILQDLLDTDSFKTPERQKIWEYTWYARRFMEEQLPFWEMQPADQLATGGATITIRIGKGRTAQLGAQVFAKPGEVYAVYLPSASPSGAIDLSAATGDFKLLWYNPRTGEFAGSPRTITAGQSVPLGAPPADPVEDWVVLIKR